MLKVLSTKYANVTIEAIELYKSLCVECLKKRKRRAVKGVVVRPILSRDYGSHGQDRTLRSSDNGLLYRPRTSSDFESNCFRSAAPLSGTHCLLLLRLLIVLVLLGLDLKLTYPQKPMPPSVSVSQRL